MPLLTTPFAQLDLIRQPEQSDEPLQAFDAADEYLLNHVAEHGLTLQTRVLVLNDNFGALAASLAPHAAVFSSTDSFLGVQALEKNLVRNDQAYDAVPVMGGGYSRAIHMADIANVRNPRLVKSLKAALLAMSNVTIHEQCEVSDFVRDGDRIIGVTTPDGDLLGDCVVLAAGAWSGDLLGKLGLELPVEPVKGQMILYKCASDFLPSMILAKGRYAIPRRDGHILIGSTLEHEGYDKTPTANALESLKASAVELIPALADAEVVGHWAGLRPGSPEGIPFIGPVPNHQGLWLNCGHFRNGLVLAPASCQLLTDLLVGDAPVIDPAPYAPHGRLRSQAPSSS